MSTKIAVPLLAAVCLFTAGAQETSVLVSGLQLPYKLVLTPAGSLLVSEAGGPPNAGRISVVSRGGARQSLLEGVPSGPSNPDLTPIGPTGLAYRDRILYITLSEGDALRSGETPGSLILNPEGVSSPLFSSILRVRLDDDPEAIQSPFVLTREQHNTLADGFDLTLENNQGKTATIDVLADFPVVSPDPVTIYRHHDPFGLTLDPAGEFLYLAEAGQNALLRIDTETGAHQVIARFAPIPNPTGFGPPVMDAVPTGAAVFGDRVIVSLLSGFPFVPGQAEVRAVNLSNGEVEPWINGLTSLTDIGYRVKPDGSFSIFVLGFSSNMLEDPPGPGQLWRYDSPTGELIVDDLAAPTGIVVDSETGEVFIAEFGGGQIRRVQLE